MAPSFVAQMGALYGESNNSYFVDDQNTKHVKVPKGIFLQPFLVVVTA